ncbi:MAG: hypothetical protein K2Y32_22820 [Candidatus Obscuribacterales bacterium]|nr:hypothetical protein [Candidatus Obscuribacterales bacterium]
MGNLHGGSFQAIQEYFQQKECRFCSNSFKPDGIQLLREEPGVLVVRVTCSTCGHPLGVAIVGTTPKAQVKPAQNHPRDWTKRDKDRLVGLPPITYDDVLNAHQFFKSLDTDWHKHLPKVGKAS